MLTVVVPTDFSKNANNAIRYAVQLSKKLKCRLVFFHGELLPLPVSADVPVMSLSVDKNFFLKKMKKQVTDIFKFLQEINSIRDQPDGSHE